MQRKSPCSMDGIRSILGWWMVLWAGAILHSSFSLAQAEIPITVEPPKPMETFEVMLIPPKPQSDIIFCTWSRELIEGTFENIVMVLLPPLNGNTTGPAYTGRETVYQNCSLHIRDLRLNDTANYTLTEGGPAVSYIGIVNISVEEYLPKPTVIVTPTPFLVESASVKLYCNTTILNVVQWLKNGEHVSEDSHLSDDNQTLFILSATKSDAGEYQCQVSNKISTSTSDVVYISVIYGPETPEIQPTDICYREHSNLVLSCSADSFPEPQYAWFQNGKELDKGPKLFIEDLTENKTGSYVCQAKNELLHKQSSSKVHQIYLERSCVSGVTITGPPEPLEGEPVSLYCTSGGEEVSYFWTKGDQVMHPGGHINLTNNNQKLEFNPCHRSDAANYICHASNSFSSSESDPYDLQVNYGPDPPVINETIDVVREQLNLTCKAVAFPNTTNIWFHNGDPVLDNPEMLILDISPKNSGNYTCRAANVLTGLIRETTLEIDMIASVFHSSFRLAQAEDTILIAFDPPNPMEKLEVMLSPPEPVDMIAFCSWSRGPSPEAMQQIGMLFRPPYYGSTQGPQFTGRETIHPNCSLSIRNLRLQDSATYMLMEGAPGLSYVGYAKITVVEFLPRPSVIAKPSNIILEFASVRLICNASEDLNIKWFKDGELFKNESQLLDNNRTLFIPSITKSDAGRYQCQVSNTTSTAISDMLNLSVLYGPSIPEIQPTERYYKEHSNVILSCSADSFPEPRYVWFHNGKQLDTGPKLYIEDFTEDKAGSYICQAENYLLHKKINGSSLEIYLEKSRVSKVTITGPSEAIEDQPVSLYCTSGGEKVSYFWTKGNQVVHPGGHISLTKNNQTLQFNPSHRNDAADYICHGSNSISFNESEPYRLDINYGPDPPVINETIDVPQAQLKLTCKAAAFPPAFYTWFYNGMELAGTILLRNISQENSGNYTCRVMNPVSFLKRSTTLEIDMTRKFKSSKWK